MPKENNTGKSKRSNNYKPYDSSNSSFVKRITSKVSEILPGPSWIINRWLTPSQINVRQERDIEDEDEEDMRQQPSITRIRLQPSFSDFTHQNHVKPDLREDAEGLSPINRGVDYDGAVAGPSGLHVRRPNFVSSTPASSLNIGVNKLNPSGDEGSDSGESSIGSSSIVLPPERNTTTTGSTIPKLATDSLKIFFPEHNFSTSTKDKYSKMNLSASSNRPRFDSYVFHNPHNKSLNSSRSSQLDDTSPFYRGRTMYGGASANLESLNQSVTSPAFKPKVINVTPVSKQIPERDTIGSSALRILRALEQMSSPVSEAKKMPLKSIPRKRKAIQPFDELTIPEMSVLLRIKKKKRDESECTLVNSLLSSDVTDSTIVEKSEHLPLLPSSSTTLTATSPQVLPSAHSLREEESEKYLNSSKGKNSESKNERLSHVNLPNIKLNTDTLSSFSLPPVKSSLTRISSSNYSDAKSHQTSNSSSPLISSSSTSSKPMFKISAPIDESTAEGHKISSIKPTFKFSNPLDADCEKPKNEFHSTHKTSETSSELPFTRQDKVELIMKSGNPNPKLKRKNIKEDKPNTFKLNRSDPQHSGSIMDYFNKNNSSLNVKDKSLQNNIPMSKADSFASQNDSNIESNQVKHNDIRKSNALETKSHSENFKSKWSCNKCFLENNNTENCNNCGISKLKENNIEVQLEEEGSKSSTDSNLKCKTCFSFFKLGDRKCTSCDPKKSDDNTSDIKVTSTSTTVPLTELFKKSTGSWECSGCWTLNKNDVESCPCCNTPKPGSTAKKDTKSEQPSFQFGIPLSSGSNTFKFGVDSNKDNDKNIPNSVSSGGFKFGEESNNPVSKPVFHFGSAQLTSGSEPKTTFFTLPTEEKTSKQSEDCEPTENKPFSFGSTSHNDDNKKGNSKIQESNVSSQVSKKVSFSDQLVEVKTISSDSVSFSTPSLSFTGTTKSDSLPSDTLFSVPKKTSCLFGNVSASHSSKDNSTSNSLFKFGNSNTSAASVIRGSVSSSNITSESSKQESNPDNEKKSSFTFFSSNASKPMFSSSGSEKKDNIFGGFSATNKTSSFGSVAASTSTSYTFNNANVEEKSKDAKKDEQSNNLFEDNQNAQPTIFGLSTKKEDKVPIFNLTKNDSKPLLFSGNTNENTTTLGSSKAEEWNPKSTFGSEIFDRKSISSPSATPFVSLASTSNCAEAKNEQFTFNPPSSQPNITPFIFKGSDASDNKCSGGFTFPMSSSSAQQQTQNTVFGVNNQQTPSIFGSSPRPLFSGSQPAASNNSAAPSFAFTAPQTQQAQGIFSFSTTPQLPSGESAAMGEGFSFGSESAVSSQSTSASSVPIPPTFDPNVKPNFNFSGGTAPTFSAQSSELVSKDYPDRKIRRAVRRTSTYRSTARHS